MFCQICKLRKTKIVMRLIVNIRSIRNYSYHIVLSFTYCYVISLFVFFSLLLDVIDRYIFRTMDKKESVICVHEPFLLPYFLTLNSGRLEVKPEVASRIR